MFVTAAAVHRTRGYRRTALDADVTAQTPAPKNTHKQQLRVLNHKSQSAFCADLRRVNREILKNKD